ncbi:uncharacterized protein L969DRAFT_16184 [Mixia osmundae IAM 14324]|uniref:ABM domain-containing protein n=1 Tax=Mixia osmundae (strain CBS 9802 / IAM 14324 / JCM 22182 / KY 12970) TaxID=764103 RepID=G7E5B5_MIXOS|nr:uncharacterized protein L969DRAFT_16184 [Mixia osmundae IAM 14324]KEI40825.1 hypothetical protein L969DRAFT_16184 [Mixia osmundae IAM 14324]GAA98025.1 hypothetical protein E5Q_04705 [Mixia osmundae IAM 14324]
MQHPSRMPTDGVIVIARLYPVKGKEDRVEEMLKTISEHSNSAKEPHCPTYRVVRSLDAPWQFAVFEHYLNKQGITDHGNAEPFNALIKAIGDEKLLDESRGGIVIEHFEQV